MNIIENSDTIIFAPNKFRRSYKFIGILTIIVKTHMCDLIYLVTRVDPCAYTCTPERRPGVKMQRSKGSHDKTFGHHFVTISATISSQFRSDFGHVVGT